MGVKFGEYVTGGVVKVPENLGSIGAFWHFTEHVVCEDLGFWTNGYLRL
jgi:hypothetical protein